MNNGNQVLISLLVVAIFKPIIKTEYELFDQNQISRIFELPLICFVNRRNNMLEPLCKRTLV